MATVIISIVLAAAVTAAGWRIYKKKKSGGCSSCSGCSAEGCCNRK